MAKALINVQLLVDGQNPQTVANELGKYPTGRMVGNRLLNYLAGVVGGKSGHLTVSVEDSTAAKASAEITVSQADAVADDTVTIGGVVLTAKSSGASTDEFNIGASDAALATNLAAAINAQATLSQVVTASSAADVVTVTCNYPGVVGNIITLATDNATAFDLNSETALSGPTSTAALASASYELGLALS